MNNREREMVGENRKEDRWAQRAGIVRRLGKKVRDWTSENRFQ